MGRLLGNWQTSLAGIGILIVTAAQWLAGETSLSSSEVFQLLVGAGLVGAKDAATGSAPAPKE